MKFFIRNINKIEHAEIQLNGLSVVVGENSTGKSTIGRVLFSTIKALSNTLSNDENRKKDLINKHVTSLYHRLFSKRQLMLSEEFNTLFPRLTTQFVRELNDATSINDFISKRVVFIERLEITPRQKALMLRDLENIRRCKEEGDNVASQLSTEIAYLIESEFLNKICSNGSNNSKVIFISEDYNAKLEYRINGENEVQDVICSRNREFFEDATYIESPLYLHIQDALRRANAYRELDSDRVYNERMIPLHIKDVVNKMDAMRYTERGMFDRGDLLQNIVHGEFIFDKKTRSIVFSQNGINYSPINVASGIKSFGMLQILLDGDFINENRILIWDEPENHLHPQWQIEFAKILVMLADTGIPILISTHSPYFLQAIRYFSAGSPLEKYVNFYLAKENLEGMSTIKDITNDLNEAFIQLAKPLNEIMNVDLKRKQSKL